MPQKDELTLTLESSDFPCDRLELRRLTGKEAISRLFDFEIEVVCLDHDGPLPEAMTGAQATVVMERFPGPGAGWHGVRRIHGIVAEVEDLLAAHSDLRAY